MRKTYLTNAKLNVDIFAKSKAVNSLDGTYQSIYKGKSQNFDELREYNVGDNVRDIDWRASARSMNILVKDYIAEKKHNVFFIIDGKYQMYANANFDEMKSDIAIDTAATLSYVAYKNGDFIGAIYTTNGDIVYHPFKQNLFNIENILKSYDEAMEKNFQKKDDTSLNKSLLYATTFIKRRMILFIITDIVGLEDLDDDLLKTLSFRNDVMVVNIKDIDLFEKKSYDLEKKRYFASMLLHKKKLAKLEAEEKDKVFKEAENKLTRNKIAMVTIEKNEEIAPKIIELLQKSKNMD